MASFLFPFPNAINHRRRSNLTPLPIDIRISTNPAPLCAPVGAHKFNFYGSFRLRRNYWSGCCSASGSPSEPPSPSEKHRPNSSGVTATFTRVKDTLQVFFGVLFWMSLFFWSSAWDGGNSGRPNKRGRTRK